MAESPWGAGFCLPAVTVRPALHLLHAIIPAPQNQQDGELPEGRQQLHHACKHSHCRPTTFKRQENAGGRAAPIPLPCVAAQTAQHVLADPAVSVPRLPTRSELSQPQPCLQAASPTSSTRAFYNVSLTAATARIYSCCARCAGHPQSNGPRPIGNAHVPERYPAAKLIPAPVRQVSKAFCAAADRAIRRLAPAHLPADQGARFPGLTFSVEGCLPAEDSLPAEGESDLAANHSHTSFLFWREHDALYGSAASAGIEHLNSLTQLTCLSFAHCAIPWVALEELTALTRVVDLNISGSNTLEEDPWIDKKDPEMLLLALDGFPRLAALNISKCKCVLPLLPAAAPPASSGRAAQCPARRLQDRRNPCCCFS